MKVELGNFKSKIEIIQQVKSKSDTGSPVLVDVVFKRCWAQQIEVKGSEDEDGKVRGIFDAAFIIKYDKNLIKGSAVGMLVKDEDDIIYNVDSVIEIKFREFIRINAIRDE